MPLPADAMVRPQITNTVQYYMHDDMLVHVDELLVILLFLFAVLELRCLLELLLPYSVRALFVQFREDEVEDVVVPLDWLALNTFLDVL